MLIRAQNKLNIVNLKNIDCINIEIIREESSRRRITSYNGDASTSIGDYSTEERAIEVLNEICNAYQYCNESYVHIGAIQPEFVFQMPEEQIRTPE